MLKLKFMKKLSVIIFIFLLFSCEKQYEDAIPEGTSLGSPNLVANLNEEGRVLLNWNIFRFCAGWICDPVVEGSSYEVFVKFPGKNDFVRIERLGKDENEYMVPNTEYGKAYEFYVASRRAGQIATSNTVMIVPNPFPEIETVMELENWNRIYSQKINIQGDKVAYISDYRWTESGQEFGVLSLFLKDLVTGETEMIRKRCYHPYWSRDGGKLIYGTTEELRPLAQGYTPIHLEMYDLETKEISLLKGGMHHNYFPTFAKDNESVLFLSDSLKRGEFGLWKLNKNENSEVLLPQIQQGGQISASAYFTSMDVSSLTDLVTIDFLREVGNKFVYNIYGYDLNFGAQMSDLVISPWNDISPSFSPFGVNSLAFVSDRSGRQQVWILDISSGNLKQVSFLKEDLYISSNGGNIISWMDQGQSLAFPVSSPTGDQKLIKIQIPN